MAITIQVDDSAVERLIGGDTQVEIDLRNGVAERFSEKHLKSLVNTPGMGRLCEKVIGEVRQTATTACEDKLCQLLGLTREGQEGAYWNPLKFIAKKPLDEAATGVLKKTVLAIIETEVKAMIAAELTLLEPQIFGMVETALRGDVNRRIREGVKAAVTAVSTAAKTAADAQINTLPAP